MKPLTPGILALAGVEPELGATLIEPINRAAEQAQLDSPNRLGGFLANCCVESERFMKYSENLRYTHATRILDVFKAAFASDAAKARVGEFVDNPEALANFVYANLYGNGPESSGDGWRFRGSGWLGVTFCSEFEEAAKATGIPFDAKPELARQLPGAAVIAAWFWAKKGCNAFADAGLWRTVIRRINPGMEAANERERLSKVLAAALTDDAPVVDA